MNGKKNIISFFIYGPFYLSFMVALMHAADTQPGSTQASQAESALKKIDNQAKHMRSANKKTKRSKRKAKKDFITFSYDNEDLVTVINSLAAQMGKNILLPQGGNAIKEKLTFHLEEKISLDEAWNELLPTILDVADLSMHPKDGMYTIMKKPKGKRSDIAREPAPIYMGVPYEQLPPTDERIRYLFYLSNIKISDKADNEFIIVLKNLLPEDALYKTDSLTNAIIIAAKSSDIKGVMKIITQLDQVSFQEKMEIIKLNHASSRIIASLFNENILKPADQINRYRLDTRKQTEGSYFSQNVKIISLDHKNSLILLGRTQAVNRIKEFIHKYIDVELESGKSILHIYQLQYLDAEKFEGVLKKIVESTRPGGAQQAKGIPITTERFFDEVIIKVDKPSKAEDLKYYGGNKLIIAARNDDWEQIKKLIEELDTPQPQVLIEILIADLTIDDQKLLGSLTRNPDKIPLPSSINFQSAHLTPGVIKDSIDNPKSIAGDLLKNAFNSDGTPATSDAGATNSAALFAEPGATLISLNDNDGQTWSLLKILKNFGHTKILSHPHVIATNNKDALVKIGETRLVEGESGGTTGGAAIRKFETIDAELKIEIRPRISSAKTVNLQVTININEFTSASTTNNTRTTRNITTNANVNTGSILALGGLIRTADVNSARETPLLSKVPILGWFFKQRTGRTAKNNLTVFISPTIIEPRLRRGVGDYTKDYVNLAKNYAQEGTLFDSLKDPVTRWFFKTETDVEEILTDFLAKDEFKIDLEEHRAPNKEIDMKKQERKTLRSPHARKNNKYTVNNTAKSTTQQQEAYKIRDLFKDEENPLLTTRSNTLDKIQQNQPVQKTLRNKLAHNKRKKYDSKYKEANKIKNLFKNEENPLLTAHAKKVSTVAQS